MPRNAKPLEREALIAQIRETAARLGMRRLTRSQFIRETGVPVRQILRHGGFSKCAQAAGIDKATTICIATARFLPLLKCAKS